jgi:tetratricopeptide (TPR) repeat protein
MNGRKVILLLGITLFVLAYSYSRTNVNAPGRLPDLEHLDLTHLTHAPPVEVPIRLFRARVKAAPSDAVSHAVLGDLYARQARETGNAAGYLRAQAALEQALELSPAYSAAKSSLAAAYAAQHRFSEALALAQRAYERDPRNSQALSVIGDAQLALGNYAEAETAYRELSARGITPPVQARMAGLEEVQGDPMTALGLMQTAAAEALAQGGTPEGVAWYFAMLGHKSFDMGHLQDARAYNSAALEIFDGYHLALVGLAEVSAAEGKYDDAIAYYRRAIAKAPDPEILAALGDLYALTGQPDQAEVQYRRVESIATLSALNRRIYSRQLANFYSNHDRHLDRALRLALAELEVRQDVFGYDAAAWAYYKNGDFRLAWQMMEEALAVGTQDAGLFFHAGMIAHRLGDAAQAGQYLRQALALNPYFSSADAEVAAQTLASLGEAGGR